MPRKPLVRSQKLPYHVTARCNNREPFPLPLDRVWRELTDECFEANFFFDAQFHAIVLMPNHLHMLVSTPEKSIDIIMHQLFGSFSKTINRLSGRSGRLFGSRYHGSLVDSENYFACALKYVYRNPVKAGICARVEEYAYSSLQGLLGDQALPLPLYFPFERQGYLIVPEEPAAQLDWLNRPFRAEHEEAIRKGLKKTRFAPPLDGWKQTLVDLKKQLL